MNDLFWPYLQNFIREFFHGILIYSSSFKQHLNHLLLTLKLLQDHHYYAKASKCLFGQTIISFLGNMISAKGVGVNWDKIQTVLGWPIPTNVKELWAFLGLAGYSCRFVKSYGMIARPLIDLMKKNAFHWSLITEKAFHDLTTVLVLQLPNFTQPFMVECDASSEGIGAILLQAEHLITYFSKWFSFSNRFKSTYDRELLALVLTLQKW